MKRDSAGPITDTVRKFPPVSYAGSTRCIALALVLLPLIYNSMKPWA